MHMKTRLTWLGLLSVCIVIISTFFYGCKKDDLNNEVVEYIGHVVYIKTTTPFADCLVQVTDGSNIHCQARTDASGYFSLTVRVSEINGNYYFLAGDATCIPKRLALSGYGQKKVDLGTIEVEGPSIPVVETKPISNISAEGASCGGNVLTDGRMDVTARGVCYGIEPYPTTDGLHTNDGEGLGEFTSNLKELAHNTIYYVRAYATNKKGTAYGEQIKFTTELGVPIVETDSVYRITAHTAKCKGHVISDGGYPVSKRGTCWSKKPDPTVDDDCTNDGSGIGEFTSSLNNLLENTTYYVRTYASNSTATVYGEQMIITTLDGLAVVTTDSVNSITATSFTAYGTVVSDCDIPVTARGFCYATTQYPTIDNAHTTAGKGLGKYQSNVSQLEYGTTYYVRAYATNETETVYGEQIVVTTRDGLPSVTTNQVTNIGSVKATCGGNVTDDGSLTVTARGICYGTEQQPTIEGTHTTDGKGLGAFTSNMNNLTDKTTYYVRAYATTAAGTAYGEQRSFVTSNGTPVVELKEITEQSAKSIICKGNVTGDGGVSITERGFCYSTSQYPTNTDAHVAIGNGMGEFVGSITNLNTNTTYYIRAYAVNSLGVGYSAQQSFLTSTGLPTVLTTQATATASTITVNGNVTDNGGFTVTERGLCYSTTNSEPILDTDWGEDGGQGNGSFSVTLYGIPASTTYYVRAFARNENGVAYGEVLTIQTQDGSASVTLGAVSNITALTASSQVTVTDAGGATLQSCGICWATTPNPTTANSKTAASGKQIHTAYNCNMTNLSPNTTYYVRGYATTDVTTTYSEQKTFTTSNGAAIITTGTITNIKALTATGSVKVTDVSGADLQNCGICWSTNPNPTISDNKAIGGNQLNTTYNCNLTELTPNTTYYVRAYATTNITTSYGSELSFKTTKGTPEITLSTLSNILTKSFVGNANITSDGGYSVTARGFCWSSTNATPTLIDSHVESGTGTGLFSQTISNLLANTNYYICAYATNSIGTVYSDVRTQITGNGLQGVHFEPNPISNIKAGSATCKVIVDYNYSDVPIISEGCCWSTTTTTPTTNDAKTNEGQATTSFTSTITNLLPSTTYYVRAYITTSYGTSYSSTYATFTTTDGLPIVTTNTITTSNVTSSSFTCGGNVTDIGDAAVTARGICWNTTGSPTINDSHSTCGSGTGSFTYTISGVSTHTQTYYVRAYATNKYGTAYGDVVIQSKNNPYHLVTIATNGTIYMIYPQDLGEMTWSQANSTCNSLTAYGFNDWRLPSREEADMFGRYNIRYYFTAGTYYWTSTTVLAGSNQYYTQNIYGRQTGSAFATSLYNVRPIRIATQE